MEVNPWRKDLWSVPFATFDFNELFKVIDFESMFCKFRFVLALAKHNFNQIGMLKFVPYRLKLTLAPAMILQWKSVSDDATAAKMSFCDAFFCVCVAFNCIWHDTHVFNLWINFTPSSRQRILSRVTRRDLSKSLIHLWFTQLREPTVPQLTNTALID